jgi:spectrin alpha
LPGLSKFEQEGIQNITALKDQLVNGNHAQSPAILKRHEEVLDRWQQLHAASEYRKYNLFALHDQYKIDEMHLNFAEKASTFNSWLEKSEIFLTDPVNCSSIEEFQVLREANKQFKESLISAQADFLLLVELDKQIKTFKIENNPYTCLTIELEETWKNLHEILNYFNSELEKKDLSGGQEILIEKFAGTRYVIIFNDF